MPGHPPQGHRPQLSGEPVTSQGALGGGGGAWLASTGKLPLLSTSLLPVALSRLRAAPHPPPPPGSNFPQPVLLPLLR